MTSVQPIHYPKQIVRLYLPILERFDPTHGPVLRQRIFDAPKPLADEVEAKDYFHIVMSAWGVLGAVVLLVSIAAAWGTRGLVGVDAGMKVLDVGTVVCFTALSEVFLLAPRAGGNPRPPLTRWQQLVWSGAIDLVGQAVVAAITGWIVFT